MEAMAPCDTEAQAFLIRHYIRLMRPAAVPAAILVAATLIVVSGLSLPPSLSGLSQVLPWTLMLAGVAMAVWYNRGRIFISSASLLAAFSGYGIALTFGNSSIAARAVYAAMTILVPVNVAAGMLLPEPGVFHHFNYRGLMMAIAEIAIVAWIASAGRNALSGLAWTTTLDHWLLKSPPMPIAGRIALLAALIVSILRARPATKDEAVRPIAVSAPAMLAAFFLACEWATAPTAFNAFMSAAATMLLAGLLQESHRLAFRDELTGLRSRRAIEERLPGLGPSFVVAMVDVDHFKKFNDTHGHAIGDQVLKLVAARLDEAGGGALAYRYGGEEFAVIFPDQNIEAALPHAEAIRAAVENYEMAIRGPDRPRNEHTGSVMRESRAPTQYLSVTVSIGLAARSSVDVPAHAVLRDADAALYRAKGAGRNRVSV